MILLKFDHFTATPILREIKLVSQVQLLLSMFLWRHSKKSCYLEYYELVLGVQKTEVKILKILQNSKMLKICQKSICQNYFLDKRYFAFLGRPFYDHRSLHAENFCYDVTNTSAVIRGLERGVCLKWAYDELYPVHQIMMLTILCALNCSLLF